MIASLNSTGSAAPLQAFAAAQGQLAVTQRRLSTGLKVQDARDDGATAAIATRVKVQIGEQSVLRDNRMRLKSLLDVTLSSVDSITDVLTRMREKALALTDTSLDTASRNALTNDMQALSSQIDQAAGNAGFNGQNLLQDNVTPTTFSFGTPAFTNTASGSFSLPASDVPGHVNLYVATHAATSVYYQVDTGSGTQNELVSQHSAYTPFSVQAIPSGGTVNYTVAAGPGGSTLSVQGADYTPDQQSSYFAVEGNGGTLNITHNGMSAASLGVDTAYNQSQNLSPATVLGRVESALDSVTSAAAYYGTKSNMVDVMVKQGDAESDVLIKGYGDLVDADMAKEAARLQAEQSRAQLAAQALSISNQTPALLLGLFH